MSEIVSKHGSHIFSSYKEFEKSFKYTDEYLYSMIFERNKEDIKLSKEKFAVKNLQKIFEATFLISPKIGFEAMSLRDLSTITGLSMGGLYSSIASKEAIAVIIKDVVAVICDEIVTVSRKQDNPIIALEALVRGFLYASTLMHPWFNFLYFETKSLPPPEQESSKQLEVEQVRVLADVLKRLNPRAVIDIDFIANMVVSMGQARYAKPWKYKYSDIAIDTYADDCLALIYKTIDY